MLRRIILFLILGFICANIYSQKIEIPIKYIVSDSGVAIRWYPTSAAAWREWSENGINIERTTISENGIPLAKPITVQLNQSGFKAIDGKLRETVIKENPKADFLFHCLGDTQQETQNIPAEILKTRVNAQNKLMYAILLLQQDLSLTHAAGLIATDYKTKPNTTYVYRLYCKNSQLSDTSTFVINTVKQTLYTPMPAPTAEVKNNGIAIAWNTTALETQYYGCFIERSLDGINFQRMNSIPIYFGLKNEFHSGEWQFFNDSIVQYDVPIYYRLVGIGYFNQVGPASEVALVVPYKECRSYPQYLTTMEENKLLFLQWDFPMEEEVNILGFNIYRSDSLHGKNAKYNATLIAPNQRKAIINTDILTNYFTVKAVTKNQTEIASLPLLVQGIDSVAPQKPIVNMASIDSNGIVNLHWFNNVESDLLGYQIYRGNSRSAELSNVTPYYLKDSLFRDTLRIDWMRDSIFYRLVAFDLRYNESHKSDFIALKIKNKIPPAPTWINSAIQKKNRLILQWAKSTSTDIEAYHIYIKNETDSNKNLWYVQNKNDTLLEDSSLTAGHTYTFYIRAKDADGLFSSWSPGINLRFIESPYLPKLTFTRIVTDTQNHRVIFYWENDGRQTYSHYRIIGSNNNASATICNAEGNRREFVWYYFGKLTFTQFALIGYLPNGRRTGL